AGREADGISRAHSFHEPRKTVVVIGCDVSVKILRARDHAKAKIVLGVKSQIRRAATDDHGFGDRIYSERWVIVPPTNLSKRVARLLDVAEGVEAFTCGLDASVRVNILQCSME